MKETDPLTHFQRRATQYQLVDGTYELFFGGICILWALFFYLQDGLSPLLSEGLLETMFWTTGFILLSFGGSFLFNQAIQAIKARLTYPRTGYVEFRQLSRTKRWARRLVQMVVAAALAALLGVFFAGRPASVSWMPLASGTLLALAMLIVAWRSRLWRYNLAALLSAIFGLGISLMRLNAWTGLALFYGSTGALLLLMGGIVLASYLRHNPYPQSDESTAAELPDEP